MRARRCARKRDDKVRKLDELGEYLSHVVVKRDKLALRQPARVNGRRAAAHEQDYTDVDDHICQRVQARRYPARKERRAGIRLILRVKVGYLFIFVPESAYNARTAQVVAGNAGKTVKL